ncbi:MAG: hypothetical protein K0S29_462 [Gammaproteobacteria bacterium]|nr:hypothetical protein [Gammaproteobacteria bacterium]
MNNSEERIASANKFIGQLQKVQDSFMDASYMPVVEFLDEAINTTQAVMANSETLADGAAIREIYISVNEKLQQLDLATKAIAPLIQALIASSSDDEKFELELILKRYFTAQLNAIEQTGEFDPNLPAKAKVDAALIGTDSFETFFNGGAGQSMAEEIEPEVLPNGFVNQEALAIAQSLGSKLKDAGPEFSFTAISIEQKEILKLNEQVAKIYAATEVLSVKAKDLEAEGCDIKAEKLRQLRVAINLRISDYVKEQGDAINTIGRMSELKASKFKADCHQIISANKGEFAQHRSVLSALANVLVAVATAFIQPVISKICTGSFSFFSTATVKSLAKAEQGINKAL